MEYLYAALLLHKAGKEISEENLTAVLEAAGVSVDANRVKSLVAALMGVDIDEALASAAMVAAAPAAAGGATTETAEEEKQEEEEEEEEIDEADLGLGSLFG
ncbi:MAG: 50S ribosomal protein P1 [Methanobacteriota archaeon]|nr:MAG: 50S ribosomal protein P1 [Euryarchaeota archaeon]